jgi:hypothetical protein
MFGQIWLYKVRYNAALVPISTDLYVLVHSPFIVSSLGRCSADELIFDHCMSHSFVIFHSSLKIDIDRTNID